MPLDEQRQYIPMTKDDILKQLHDLEIEFVELWFTDITGAVKTVLVPTGQMPRVIDVGVPFDGSAIEGFARVAESDMVLMPDLDTFAVLPWNESEEDRTARLVCSVRTPQGDPFIGDPRNVLIRVLEEAESMGFSFMAGLELEFFLFYTDSYGNPVLTAPQDHAGYFDHVEEAAQRVRRRMLRALLSMDICVEMAHSETGFGQHEIDFQYTHALVAADSLLTSRVLLKTIAQQNELFCTFMPRPVASMPGSGLHTHQSLHDLATNENRFRDTDHEYGLSQTARHFLAGQLAHARGMCAILAPLVNSYKRLGTSFEAPVYVTWAHINRGALVRVPNSSYNGKDESRIELRSADSSTNPYLALAVMLASGLDGIRQRLSLPEPLEETLLMRNRGRLRQVEMLPTSLEEALRVMQSDDLIMDTLGPYIGDRYVAAKQQEVDEFNQQVTAWEVNRYLKRY